MKSCETNSGSDTSAPVALVQPGADESVGRLIGLVRAQFMTGLDEALQGVELTGMQYIVLKMIASGRCKTAIDLCRAVNYDTGSMTRVLDKLEKKNLIRRERSTEDRRIVHLSMTSDGQRQIPLLIEVGNTVAERYLHGFSHAEIAQLQSYLLRILENGTRPRSHAKGTEDNPHTGDE